jgi:hypothetical protein
MPSHRDLAVEQVSRQNPRDQRDDVVFECQQGRDRIGRHHRDDATRAPDLLECVIEQCPGPGARGGDVRVAAQLLDGESTGFSSNFGRGRYLAVTGLPRQPVFWGAFKLPHGDASPLIRHDARRAVGFGAGRR